MAPSQIDADIAGVAIGQNETYITIPGNRFSCAATGRSDRVQCKVTLEGRPLEMTVTYAGISQKQITGCQATYAARPVNCTSGFNAGRKGLRPFVRINDNLGLSPQQLQKLRQANLAANLSEHHWLRLAAGIAIAAAIALMLLWLDVGKRANSPVVIEALYCLSIGLIAFGVSWFFLLANLLSLGFVD